jgi:hypothetical protein
MRRRPSLICGLLLLCTALAGCSENADDLSARDSGSATPADVLPGELTGDEKTPPASDAEMVAVHLELPGMT